jgi:hypothetical protein
MRKINAQAFKFLNTGCQYSGSARFPYPSGVGYWSCEPVSTLLSEHHLNSLIITLSSATPGFAESVIITFSASHTVIVPAIRELFP